MNGSKLLLIGVLVGFGGGMTAAIGLKLAQRGGKGGGAVAAPSPEASETAAALADSVTPGESATPYDLATNSPVPTPFEEPTARAERTAKAGSTRFAALPKRTPRANDDDDAIDLLPVEGPPAKLVFAKATGEGTALTRITEVRAADTSTVRVELTGKARYKILELPKRHEVWIDFEEVQVPGGDKSSPGSKVHVEELRARAFDEGAIARVTLKLANEGKFSVSVSDGFAEVPSAKGKGRTGEADGMLEIILSGFVPMEMSGDP